MNGDDRNYLKMYFDRMHEEHRDIKTRLGEVENRVERVERKQEAEVLPLLRTIRESRGRAADMFWKVTATLIAAALAVVAGWAWLGSGMGGGQ